MSLIKSCVLRAAAQVSPVPILTVLLRGRSSCTNIPGVFAAATSWTTPTAKPSPPPARAVLRPWTPNGTSPRSLIRKERMISSPRPVEHLARSSKGLLDSACDLLGDLDAGMSAYKSLESAAGPEIDVVIGFLDLHGVKPIP